MTGILKRIGTYVDTWNGEQAARRFRKGWPASASPNVHFYRTSGVQYRYAEFGSGPTLVLAVDSPMTIEVYGDLLATFGRKFRVIVVELPAMGFSAAMPSFNFYFQETNDNIAAFLAAVAGEGAILAFSCVASLAALDIAYRYPRLVSHLCLIQGGSVAAFRHWKEKRDPKGILARPVLGQLAMKRLAPSRMSAWYDLTVGRRDLVEHFCDCAGRAFENGAQWSLATAYQSYLVLVDELPRPAQPMLSIWGTSDGSHPEASMHSLAAIYHDVATVTLDGLGHTPELEDPGTVLAHIVAFVGGHAD